MPSTPWLPSVAKRINDIIDNEMAPKRRQGFGLAVQSKAANKGHLKGLLQHDVGACHYDDYGRPFIIVDADDYDTDEDQSQSPSLEPDANLKGKGIVKSFKAAPVDPLDSVSDTESGSIAYDDVEDDIEEVVPWAERQQQCGITSTSSNARNLSKAAWRRRAAATKSSAPSSKWKDSGSKTKTPVRGGIQFGKDRRRSFVVIDKHGKTLDVDTGMMSMIADGHIGKHSTQTGSGTGNLTDNFPSVQSQQCQRRRRRCASSCDSQ